jgi:hypothetical protein
VIAQAHQIVGALEPVAEARHVFQVGRVHTVIAQADEVIDAGPRRACCLERVDERKADIAQREPHRLIARRRADAALRQSGRERRTRVEVERAAALTIRNPPVACKRAGIADKAERDVRAVRGELIGGEPGEHREPDRVRLFELVVVGSVRRARLQRELHHGPRSVAEIRPVDQPLSGIREISLRVRSAADREPDHETRRERALNQPPLPADLKTDHVSLFHSYGLHANEVFHREAAPADPLAA